MLLPRLVPALAFACVLAGLTGCGQDDQRATGAPAASDDPAPTTAATPTPSATATPTKRATSTPEPTEGDGDGEGDDAPATAGGGVCGDLSAAAVGDVVGGEVKGAGISGGGCEFRPAARKGISVTVLDRAAAEAGGMDGARGEATSAVEGEPEEVDGIGAEAFVVTGPMFGSTEHHGAGAVRVGNRIITVFIVQREVLPPARIRAIEVDLLALVARAKSQG